MLQSLYQGQILVMQSLQDVALQRPIMIVEQFIEKVAWPGAQPSLVREGRDPTA